MLPTLHLAMTFTSVGLASVRPPATHFNKMLFIQFQPVSSQEMNSILSVAMSSILSRLQCIYVINNWLHLPLGHFLPLGHIFDNIWGI